MKYLILFAIPALFACNKQDTWLDVKSNKTDIVPVTLENFQSILDNDVIMNSDYPCLGLLGSDNYYVTYETWQPREAIERNAYIWKPDLYEGGRCLDWEYPYQMVEYANVVLDGIKDIPVNSGNKDDFNRIKGSALFYRAYAFFNLAQLFAVPYNAETASADLGIPIRLTSDINERSVRSTVEQSYAQIIADLTTAQELLPSSVSSRLRPSKTAALALLARVSFFMKAWDKAIGFATGALNIQSDLVDFNSLDTTAAVMLAPFPPGNQEVIFFATTNPYFILSRSNLKVDTLLYRSYDQADLRRIVFYRNNGENGISFRGDYTGKAFSYKFAGLATNELYLIRAESYARLNKPEEALTDLNSLLENRWVSGTYIPLAGMSSGEALATIIKERRKELPFTGNLRWEDLRRLNQENMFASTITRILNGETFALPPNDKRYVFAIPDNEINQSGIQQNTR